MARSAGTAPLDRAQVGPHDRRRRYLPDPMEQTVEILTARISQLEEQVATLTAQAAPSQDVRFPPDGGETAQAPSGTEE